MKHVRFKKLRLWLAYPVFIIYPFVARIADFSFVSGAVVILIGMAVRFWASGYIRKSRELATAGPYAHTRNPLYLGNFIIGLGVCVVSTNVGLVVYYAIVFTLVYLGTIKEEEEVLAEKFGPPYKDYLRHVPRFWPSVRVYHLGKKTKFDLRLSFKNGEFIRLCGFSLLILFFDLWRRLFVKKEALGMGGRGVLFLFVVFLGLLWFNIFIRRKSERSQRSGQSEART
ncbi:MAG: isoprenylcysteine carboxylmethyltransferase family protein [Candidatus Omnitrophota bacterium]